MGNFLNVQYGGASPDDDLTLWQQFVEGSNTAYESIYQKYAGELYRYASVLLADKSLVEDVIHDVFTDLWSSRKKLGAIRSVRLYLFSSIKRRALRKLRKEKTFAFFDVDYDRNSFEVIPSFLDELVDNQNKEDLAKSIRRCLSTVSKRQREIIYLRFYQDMSYPEIAQLLQLDQKYVYNLASKAFCALRKILPPLVSVSFLSGINIV